jgi:formate/nitrite transporter
MVDDRGLAHGRTADGIATGFDALLPADMARRAEEVGVRKAAMNATPVLALAVLAGAFIALGATFSIVSLSGTPAMPWGPARVLAGVVFSVGLILVIVGGAELFTGNNLIVMAWASGRVATGALLRNWTLVYLGNLVGALSIALALVLAGSHRAGGGAFGATALRIAADKLGLEFGQAVVLGILCNALVCLAVWLALSARTTADRVLAIAPPISAFVAAGFEHSIANMFFIPLGLLISALDPAFVTLKGLEGPSASLSWTALVTRNLVPVTLGNVIGGAGLVGGAYWFIYLRDGRRLAQPGRAASRGVQSMTDAPAGSLSPMEEGHATHPDRSV